MAGWLAGSLDALSHREALSRRLLSSFLKSSSPAAGQFRVLRGFKVILVSVFTCPSASQYEVLRCDARRCPHCIDDQRLVAGEHPILSEPPGPGGERSLSDQVRECIQGHAFGEKIDAGRVDAHREHDDGIADRQGAHGTEPGVLPEREGQFGCKRSLSSQLCTVCTSAADVDCVAKPSNFVHPTLAKAVAKTTAVSDESDGNGGGSKNNMVICVGIADGMIAVMIAVLAAFRHQRRHVREPKFKTELLSPNTRANGPQVIEVASRLEKPVLSVAVVNTVAASVPSSVI